MLNQAYYLPGENCAEWEWLKNTSEQWECPENLSEQWLICRVRIGLTYAVSSEKELKTRVSSENAPKTQVSSEKATPLNKPDICRNLDFSAILDFFHNAIFLLAVSYGTYE